MQTTIVKWGNSRGVRIPKILLDIADLSDTDTVELTAEDNKIIIKKANGRKHRTFQERFAGYDGDYEFTELDSGSPVGREVF